MLKERLENQESFGVVCKVLFGPPSLADQEAIVTTAFVICFNTQQSILSARMTLRRRLYQFVLNAFSYRFWIAKVIFKAALIG